MKEYKGDIFMNRQEQTNQHRVEQFAGKWLADHKTYDTDEIMVESCRDITDEQFKEAFKGCVIPLDQRLYERCRVEIKRQLKDNYRIEV